MSTESNFQGIILVTNEMLPIPEELNTKIFGEETIVDTTNGTVIAKGTATSVAGDNTVVEAWLKPFDSIWIAINPFGGKWHQVHIA